MFKRNMLILVLVFSSMITRAQVPESAEDWTRYFNSSFLPADEAKKYQVPEGENFQDIATKQLSGAERSRQSVQAMDESVSPDSEDAPSNAEIAPAELIFQLPDEIRKEEAAAPSSALKNHYQIYQTQYPIHKQVFEYARHVLSSVENNGWLVVNGHLDTYPLRALQSNQGFRTDVQVVNLQWLKSSEKYRELISNKLGVQQIPIGSSIEMIRILQGNLGSRLHLSMTLPTEIPGAMMNEITPRGLVFSLDRNADHRSKHRQVLESVNWQSVTNSSSPEYIQALNQNYLAALLIHKKMQLPQEIGSYQRDWILEQLYQQRPLENNAKKYLQNK